MARIRSTLIIAGVALGASALLPAVPASADSIARSAHALFRNDADNVGMDLDVVKDDDGRTTIDVEWQDSHCAPTDTAYVCDSVFRTAYGVPVSRFRFSLTGVTTVEADLAYREVRRHCTFTEETEDCTEVEAAGTTTVEVAWTATGEPTSSDWTDEQGVRHVEKRSEATVTGTGFGLSYGPDASFGVVSQVRTRDLES
ncbi:hypothetical protein ONA70_30150 [Micromonospora yasonensis]|uniref:hypothetical protein n=1 Tax=Micromonospora yasonensis TaxID=1128667 RepID=UPI00223138D5|nr:hypothetical protein [Micromonospora yasonensis]MCW3844360.1 hypothetical protein [Micromonospora yasonensis]